MKTGRFITLEGGEGGGKSTQARLLCERIRALGLEAVLTREPGGSPGAEALRSLLVTGEVDRWSPLSETLILYAARRDHIERLILPALERGAFVVCDRFYDSTRAYQGAAGGVDPAFIAALEREVLGEVRPDLTFILDLDPDLGLARAGRRGEADTRFEEKGPRFHHRLREEFLAIADREPQRCLLISAEPPVAAVAEEIWSATSTRLLGDGR